MITPKQRKRYRLYQIIKHHFRYEATNHTVMVPYDLDMDTLPTKVTQALNELKKLKYSLQTEIQ